MLEGCAKIKPRIDFRSILAHPSTTSFEKTGFHVEGVRQGTFADAHPPRENLSFQEKCWKGVPKSTPGLEKTLKTYMGAQSTKSRIYCFSYSRMVAVISRRVFRCFEKVVPSRPDRPTNAIAQPDRPDIDRKKLHRPARSTSTSSEQLSSTTNSTI